LRGNYRRHISRDCSLLYGLRGGHWLGLSLQRYPGLSFLLLLLVHSLSLLLLRSLLLVENPLDDLHNHTVLLLLNVSVKVTGSARSPLTLLSVASFFSLLNLIFRAGNGKERRTEGVEERVILRKSIMVQYK
jgi:hypothetical protein